MFGAYKLRMWVHGLPGILCENGMLSVYSWLLRNLVYSTSVRFIVSRGTVAVTGFSADAGYLCDKPPLFRDTKKGTFYSVREKFSLVLLDLYNVYYKKLAFGISVTEIYTSANETVFIREYWAPLVVSFHERLGFLCIQITFSVDLKQLSHKIVEISGWSSMSACFVSVTVID